MTYALAKKPAVGGMPVSDSRKSVIRIAEQRLAPAEPGERVQAGGHAGPLLERGDHRERAEVHERVGRAVEEQRPRGRRSGRWPPAKAARPTSM